MQLRLKSTKNTSQGFNILTSWTVKEDITCAMPKINVSTSSRIVIGLNIFIEKLDVDVFVNTTMISMNEILKKCYFSVS